MKFISAVWAITILLPILLVTTEVALSNTEVDKIEITRNQQTASDSDATVSKDRMFMALSRDHTRVFAKDDLFKERFDPKELQIWYRFLNDVKTFVAANGRGDQKFDTALNSILENNDTLINTLKMTFNSLFAPGGGYQEAVIKNAMQKFQQINDTMATLQKSISKENYLYKSKKDVRDLLERVALYTENTAQTARNNLLKKTQRT